jgi:hypothetical protein
MMVEAVLEGDRRGEGSVSNDDFNLGPDRPVILHLRKRLGDPMFWRVVTADGEVRVSTAELRSYEKFSHVCLEQFSKFYLPVVQGDWLKYLGTREISEEYRS